MDDDFEKDFMNKVNLATRAEQLAVEETKAAVEAAPVVKPVASAAIASVPETSVGFGVNGTTKKALLVFVILAVAFFVLSIVLIVALIVTNNRPSISVDENVRVNKFGRVEAIGVYCEMGDETLYLDKSNNYFVELTNVSDTLVEVKEGVYEQLDTNLEYGNYVIDGKTIHFLPDGERDYYAEYSSHSITLNGHKYSCKNYDEE